MARRRSAGRWVLVGTGVLVLGFALWGLNRTGSTPPSVPETAAAGKVAAPAELPAQAAAAGPPGARVPAQRIAEHGRLAVELSALRDGEVLALGLEMPDDARGRGVRPVKVVDVEGRVLETTAAAADGPGTGLRLEIDPDWLRPGRYMIQVETAEKQPLALRRYVLEVR